MSTRCHIAVYENATDTKPSALLYRHSDGYPEGQHGVVTSLANFLAKFMKGRGWDSEYLPAQLLHSMIQHDVEHRTEYLQADIAYSKKELSKYKEDADDAAYLRRRIQRCEEELREPNNFLGYGICTETHGDINYFYRVDPSGVHCFEWSMRAGCLGQELTTPKEAMEILDGKVPEKFQDKPKEASA